ncbi:MAG: sigma factor-like helix-turn-helix DNA-binding protein [Patescibacteria group bacterium]
MEELILKREVLAEIITSNPSFNTDYPPTYEIFSRLYFESPEFTGCGKELLEQNGHLSRSDGYRQFVGSIVPDAAGSWAILVGSGGWNRFTLDSAPEDLLVTLAFQRDQDDAPDLDFLLEARRSSERIAETFRRLDPRHQQIVIRFLGLENDTPQTTAEIAEAFGIHRSRVHQIFVKAMELLQLREPSFLAYEE